MRTARITPRVAFSPPQPHRGGEKVPKADEGRSRDARASYPVACSLVEAALILRSIPLISCICMRSLMTSSW